MHAYTPQIFVYTPPFKFLEITLSGRQVQKSDDPYRSHKGDLQKMHAYIIP